MPVKTQGSYGFPSQERQSIFDVPTGHAAWSHPPSSRDTSISPPPTKKRRLEDDEITLLPPTNTYTLSRTHNGERNERDDGCSFPRAFEALALNGRLPSSQGSTSTQLRDSINIGPGTYDSNAQPRTTENVAVKVYSGTPETYSSRDSNTYLPAHKNHAPEHNSPVQKSPIESREDLSFDYSKVPKGPKPKLSQDDVDEILPSESDGPYILIDAFCLQPQRKTVGHLLKYFSKKGLWVPKLKMNEKGYYLFFPKDAEGEANLLNFYALCNGEMLFSSCRLDMEVYPHWLRPLASRRAIELKEASRNYNHASEQAAIPSSQYPRSPTLNRFGTHATMSTGQGQDYSLSPPVPVHDTERLSQKFRRTTEPRSTSALPALSAYPGRTADEAKQREIDHPKLPDHRSVDRNEVTDPHRSANSQTYGPGVPMTLPTAQLPKRPDWNQFQEPETTTNRPTAAVRSIIEEAIESIRRDVRQVVSASPSTVPSLGRSVSLNGGDRDSNTNARDPQPESDVSTYKARVDVVGDNSAQHSQGFPTPMPLQVQPPPVRRTLSHDMNPLAWRGQMISSFEEISAQRARVSGQEKGLPIAGSDQGPLSVPTTSTAFPGYVRQAEHTPIKYLGRNLPIVEKPRGDENLTSASAIKHSIPRCSICKKKVLFRSEDPRCLRCREAQTRATNPWGEVPANSSGSSGLPQSPDATNNVQSRVFHKSPGSVSSRSSASKRGSSIFLNTKQHRPGMMISKRAPSRTWGIESTVVDLSKRDEEAPKANLPVWPSEPAAALSRPVSSQSQVLLNKASSHATSDVKVNPSPPSATAPPATTRDQSLVETSATKKSATVPQKPQPVDRSDALVSKSSTLPKRQFDTKPKSGWNRFSHNHRGPGGQFMAFHNSMGSSATHSSPSDFQKPLSDAESHRSLPGASEQHSKEVEELDEDVEDSLSLDEDLSLIRKAAIKTPMLVPEANTRDTGNRREPLRSVLIGDTEIQTTVEEGVPHSGNKTPANAEQVGSTEVNTPLEPTTLIELAALAIMNTEDDRISAKQATEWIMAQNFAKYDTDRRNWQGGLKAKFSGNFKRDTPRASDGGLAYYTFHPGQRDALAYLLPKGSKAAKRTKSVAPAKTIRRNEQHLKSPLGTSRQVSGSRTRSWRFTESTEDESSRGSMPRSKRRRRTSPGPDDGDVVLDDQPHRSPSLGLESSRNPQWRKVKPRLTGLDDRDKYGYTFDLSDVENPFDDSDDESSVDSAYDRFLDSDERINGFDDVDLFAARPDLHPSKIIDAEVKIQEIKTRPTRGERKRLKKQGRNKLPLTSLVIDRRLNRTRPGSPSDNHASSEQEDVVGSQGTEDKAAQAQEDFLNFRDEPVQYKEVKNVEGVFDIQENMIPVYYEGQLAFRDGTMIDGELRRAKTLYKVARIEHSRTGR